MRLFFLIIVFCHLINSLIVFAEKVKNDSKKFNTIKWEKVQGNKSINLKKIIWKSYKDDESYFKKTIYKPLDNYTVGRNEITGGTVSPSYISPIQGLQRLQKLWMNMLVALLLIT